MDHKCKNIKKMKIIGTIASIKSDSNKLISTTLADWSGIRETSYIKFLNDNNFYPISKIEKKIYIKDFEVIKSDHLRINEDTGLYITDEDSLSVSYKEYELSTIYKIVSSGKGYKPGDKITLDGGIPSLDKKDNLLLTTILEVRDVGNEGEIKEVSVDKNGCYVQPPENICNINGGSGSGASIDAAFKLIDFRTFVDKDISRVDFKGSHTDIFLIYPLQEGVKTGKVSVEKWEITLSSNYVGTTKANEVFEVLQDLTPNCNLLLIAKNSKAIETISNRNFLLIDQQIGYLKQQLKDLEQKLKN